VRTDTSKAFTDRLIKICNGRSITIRVKAKSEKKRDQEERAKREERKVNA
jgi:hypothetical protein